MESFKSLVAAALVVCTIFVLSYMLPDLKMSVMMSFKLFLMPTCMMYLFDFTSLKLRHAT